MVTAVAVADHLVAVVASVATAEVIVLNHAARLALKAVLKVVAISVPKVVSNPVVISVANNAALHLAVAKAVSSPAAISALTTVAVTASKHATIATAVHPALQARQEAVTMLAAAQPTALRLVAPKSWVLATSNHTQRVVMRHRSALAPKC